MRSGSERCVSGRPGGSVDRYSAAVRLSQCGGALMEPGYSLSSGNMREDHRRDVSRDCPLAGALANRLRSGREELTRRWLDRIGARVSIGLDRVFPGEELLDHIPLLIDGIADYVENPAEEVAADAPVVAKGT